MEIIQFKELEKTELFEKFKIQLLRDFELCGFLDVAPKINSNKLEHLIQEVLNSVLKLEKKGNSSIQNLLYRIDITELQIKQEHLKSLDKNFHLILSELIIKRVLQKIILKEKYSK
jgi:hypothetical protein